VEAKGWEDERLKVMVLQVVALYAHGKIDEAVQLLGEALAACCACLFKRSDIN
jgi:LuxR family maltose regulon positive regulatory protein